MAGDNANVSATNTRKFGRNQIGLIVILVVLVTATPFLLLRLTQPRDGGVTGGGGDNLFSGGPPFDSIHSLKGNSTIVVLAEVQNFTTFYGMDNGGNPRGPFFDFRLTVLTYIKGSGPQTIYLDAGPNSTITPEIGKQYALFLQLDTPCLPFHTYCTEAPSDLSITYHSTGGVQGRFLARNGLVYGFKTLYPEENSWVIVDANGVLLAQFISQVQTA